MKVAAVIPARMASSRFPGKPLVSVRGLPMVEHVRRRVERAGCFSEVVVATCDREVADAVRAFGGKVRMTAPTHEAATDRVREAAHQLDCSHVLNVQGDEILVLPEDLATLVRALEQRPEVPAWNAVGRITDPADLANRSIVKCAVSLSGRILFCARDFSSLVRNGHGAPESLRSVLGILGYRRDYLDSYGRLVRTPLEKAESIDQSRILENDGHLQSVTFSKDYMGINEPHEVQEVERILETDPLQKGILMEILRA